jgi:hypothetical protein
MKSMRKFSVVASCASELIWNLKIVLDQIINFDAFLEIVLHVGE